MNRRPLSRATTEALTILGDAIRVARIQKGWTVRDLAERVGVSHVTILKVEHGEPSVAAGTALEAATLVGVPLFDEDAQVRERYGAQQRGLLALLPSNVRARRQVDDDF